MSHRSLFLGLVTASAILWGLSATPMFSQSRQSFDCCDPRIPINHLPFNIQRPGSYVVTAHLIGSVGSHGIRVWEEDVTINLNGFTLVGVPGSLNGVDVPRTVRLTLRNGTIKHWGGNGVAAPDATVRMSDVVVSGCGQDGVKVGPDSAMRDSLSSRNGGRGVVLGQACSLSEVQATENAGAGFVAGPETTLVRCLARDNLGNGIELDAAASAIGCQSFDNADGIVTGRGSVVRDNLCRKNSGNGIRVDEGGTICDNVLERNGTAAIHVLGNENHLARNRMVHHPVGLHVDGSKNVVINTFAQENVVDYDLADDTYFEVIFNPDPGVFDERGAWANFNFLEQ